MFLKNKGKNFIVIPEANPKIRSLKKSIRGTLFDVIKLLFSQSLSIFIIASLS